jgi:hypothetical protein
MDQRYISVGEAADELSVRPRLLSDMFYGRQLNTERCPVVAGRRLIPRDYLPEIAEVIRAQLATVAS